MDQTQRARSNSSNGQQPALHHDQSPSGFPNPSIGLGLTLDKQHVAPSTNFADNDFSDFLNSQSGLSFADQSNSFNQAPPSQQPSFTQDLLGASVSSAMHNEDFALFATTERSTDQYDPALFTTDMSPQPEGQDLNAAGLRNMSSPQPPAQTSPSLLHMHSPSLSHHSPSYTHNQFPRSPGHSRDTSFGQHNQMPNVTNATTWDFPGHRRTPSEYSNVSSALHSPNLDSHNSFDVNRSPMHGPQDAALYSGIESFSLSDRGRSPGLSSPGMGFSPGHTPARSPSIMPQDPMMSPGHPYFLGMTGGVELQPGNMYGQSKEPFPQIPSSKMSLDIVQEGSTQTPAINVDFAEPVPDTNSTKLLNEHALTPPLHPGERS